MGINQDRGALRHLREAYDGAGVAGLTDRELLERFASRRGESAELAFAALVKRHGPMVLRVCRAGLRDEHEAQDAFQAVFLILVRRAGSIWLRDSLGPWLHGVALRVAACARASAARRQAHERRCAEMAARSFEQDGDDLAPVLHAEIGRLPDRYRAAVVLCDLEGLTHQEAAHQLGWPVGTVKSRQARGRERLRERLTRRGLAPAVGALGTILAAESASASIPSALIEATTRAAMRPAAAGAVSACIAALTEETLKIMFRSKWKMIAGCVLLVGVAVAGVGALAQQGGRQAPGAPARAQVRQKAGARPIPRVDDVRAPEREMMGFAKARKRVDAEPKGAEPPVPKAIAVHVAGRAVDTAGQPVAGATVYLMDAWMRPRIVAETTTDRDGEYAFDGPEVPVTDGSVNGVAQSDVSPFAAYRVAATARGYGLSWHQPESTYAVAEPDPDDIQGRRPLGEPVAMDLTFRPADTLRGRVVDESGRPLEGVELSILDADLLDADGLETSRNSGSGWDILPGKIGRSVTGSDGRFRIDGLPSETCFWLSIKRPEFPSFGDYLYAATIERPVAEHGQPKQHNGRGPHAVYSGDFQVTLPTPRRLMVRVVADDTGKPLPGVWVNSLNENLATGIHSGGQSDAEGKLQLELPPGRYRGVVGDPPIATRYIRTYQRELAVAPEPAEQPYEFRMKPGFELRIDATDGETGEGVPNALFWLVPTDDTDKRIEIQASTFGGAVPWTGEDGRMRAVLQPEPGKTYRATFAGIRLPNYPEYSFGLEGDQPKLDIEPTQSEPFELAPGESIHLRFTVRPRAD